MQKEKTVLVEVVVHTFDKTRYKCKVVECNPHFANFAAVTGEGVFSGALSRITASYVDQMDMIMFTISGI